MLGTEAEPLEYNITEEITLIVTQLKWREKSRV